MSLYQTNRINGSEVTRTSYGSVAEAPVIPPMPQIGHQESSYARQVRVAERRGDTLLRDATKVGQYITLASNPMLGWPEKLRYYKHALHRHCVPPPWPDESVWMFYQSLANLVRENAGHQALLLASAEDDLYAVRLDMGVPREKIEAEAEHFLSLLVPSPKPEWINEEDYVQLILIRDHWI